VRSAQTARSTRVWRTWPTANCAAGQRGGRCPSGGSGWPLLACSSLTRGPLRSEKAQAPPLRGALQGFRACPFSARATAACHASRGRGEAGPPAAGRSTLPQTANGTPPPASRKRPVPLANPGG
jgi:hypothetical protein